MPSPGSKGGGTPCGDPLVASQRLQILNNQTSGLGELHYQLPAVSVSEGTSQGWVQSPVTSLEWRGHQGALRERQPLPQRLTLH